ncbi:putative plastidic glucose transporter 1 [Morella rubra]|uniref:Putative plastidic glucose transporter 1 n=1 Tax=Morella rubra TaxID=262757 RepID=A0A6A1UR10_9ROSI|nr:putative plastidic glucose transporter 1 [Morella rubra]
MWVDTVQHQRVGPVPAIKAVCRDRKLFVSLPKRKAFHFDIHFRIDNLKVSAAKKQQTELKTREPVCEQNLEKVKNGEGFDLGWLPAFPHVTCDLQSNEWPIVSIAQELGFEGNSIVEGLVVSIFIAGAFVGSISCGSLVDKLGCRRTFQIDTIPLILGALLSAHAHSVDEMLWGRFLVGLGIGVNIVLVPIYISEVASTKYRGSLGTLCQICTCLGIISSLFLGIPSGNDPHGWRMILYIASVPGFIVTLGMQFAVDSPRWLCKAGRIDEAKAVIHDLWGASEVEKAIKEFQSVGKNDGSDLNSRWLELLEEPHSRVAFIGGALFVLQQFAGINGVLYFSSLTFQDVGVTNGPLASLVVGLTNLAGALCALCLIDKQGRRRLLIGSYLGMAVSMFLVVYAISFPLDATLSHNLSILGTVLYILTFAIGAGPVTGLIIPELSSTRMRGKIMGFSFTAHWVDCLYFVMIISAGDPDVAVRVTASKQNLNFRISFTMNIK